MECSPQRPPAKRMSTGVGDSMANAIDFLGRPRPPHWPENPRWDAAETAWGWLGTDNTKEQRHVLFCCGRGVIFSMREQRDREGFDELLDVLGNLIKIQFSQT